MRWAWACRSRKAKVRNSRIRCAAAPISNELGVPDMESELRYVMDAVRLIRHELDGRVPLIGFSGSPWTLACYMVEGQGSRDFATAKAMCWNDPALAHTLLDTLAQIRGAPTSSPRPRRARRP